MTVVMLLSGKRFQFSQVLLCSYPFPCLFRHKKYKERKEKYSPSDAAAANKKESRDTKEMATMANTAALQQDTESPKSPVAATGPSTTTGATITTTTTASSIVSEATTTKPAPPTTGGTGKARAEVDPFHLSEDQISLNRGMF